MTYNPTQEIVMNKNEKAVQDQGVISLGTASMETKGNFGEPTESEGLKTGNGISDE